MAERKKLIAANWKMHPRTAKAARRLFDGVKERARALKTCEVLVCPPFLFLPDVLGGYRGKKIALGAQDAFYEAEGSYTGEVSAVQLKELGVSWTIAGHSERRALGEDNELINKKVNGALAAGLSVILCAGEDERDRDGAYLAHLRAEVVEGLRGVSVRDLERSVTIAYEPRWAIGKSADEAMQPDDVHSTILFIRKVLTEEFGAEAAQRMRVLYGGSAEPENAAALVYRGTADGLLVGHASLSADSFGDMLDAVEKGE